MAIAPLGHSIAQVEADRYEEYTYVTTHSALFGLIALIAIAVIFMGARLIVT